MIKMIENAISSFALTLLLTSSATAVRIIFKVVGCSERFIFTFILTVVLDQGLF